jgi:ABC-type multidrug transport system fused ATPase/permease subunit
MQNTAEAQVATKRIVELLLLPEVPERSGPSAIVGEARGLSAVEAGGEVMRMRGDFTWGAVGAQARGHSEEEKNAKGDEGSGEGTGSGEHSGGEEREGRRRRRGRGRGRGGLREPLLAENGRAKEPLLADIARMEEGEGSVKVHVRGVQLSVRRGELVMVCGAVGAGKTTLLDAVLGKERHRARIVFFLPRLLPGSISTLRLL